MNWRIRNCFLHVSTLQKLFTLGVIFTYMKVRPQLYMVHSFLCPSPLAATIAELC